MARHPLRRQILVTALSNDLADHVGTGFFYRLGMVKPGTVSGDHHTPTFLADDSCIPVGVRAMSYLLLDYLERHK